MSRIRFVAAILGWALAARTVYLFAAYALQVRDVRRYHVEAATAALVLFGAVSKRTLFVDATGDTAGVSTDAGTNGGQRSWLLPIFVAAAFLLFWPALHVGWLSDDFGLTQDAANWRIGFLTPVFFRPVAMFIWAAGLHVGAGPIAFHALNIALHGANGYLTTRLARLFGIEGWWSLVAGLVMLSLPVLVEPVTWSSGVFDVMSTTLALVTVLVSAHYRARTGVGVRAAFFVCTLAAVFTKEAGVMVPVLVFLVAACRRSFSKTLVIDTVIAVVILGAYGVFRAHPGGNFVSGAWEPYVAQRALFSAFGAFSVPVHTERLRDLFPAVLAGVAILATVFASHAFTRGSTRDARRVLGGLAWVALGILPVVPIAWITEHLEASRYLYLSSVGWSLAVAAAMAGASAHASTLVRAASIVLLVINTAFLRINLRPWVAAGVERDAIERAAGHDSRLRACPAIELLDLPDSVDGAYVFRNDARAAFIRDLAVVVDPSVRDAQCRFRWHPETSTFASP